MEFKNINEAQLVLLREILTNGDTVETRGLKTLELSPVIFSITEPLERITTINNRNWDFNAAIGELIWHLSASNDLDFISTYLKQWGNYSDDGRFITGSCYGHKIFKKGPNGKNQWNSLINLLKDDPGSRRAVLSLYDNSEGLSLIPKDVPCTCSLQFLIRNKKVNIIVHMRSNDIILGLPYDFFFFSFLQELLASTLNLGIGIYTHIAGSLHLYHNHFKLAEKILASDTYEKFSMSTIENAKNIDNFIAVEDRLRKKDITLKEINESGLEKYWTDLLKVLYYFKGQKKGISQSELLQIKSQTSYSVIL